MLEVAKKIANLANLEPDAPWAVWTGRFFIDLQLWPLIFLQPINLQGCTVPQLKDLIKICLELAAQDPSRTLKVLCDILNNSNFTSWSGKKT